LFSILVTCHKKVEFARFVALDADERLWVFSVSAKYLVPKAHDQRERAEARFGQRKGLSVDVLNSLTGMHHQATAHARLRKQLFNDA
jgi:hypothetical protein